MDGEVVSEHRPGEVSGRLLTLPNVLSILRLVGVPIFLWAIVAKEDGWALLVLMLSGITDYADGKIARTVPHGVGLASCWTPSRTDSTS